MRYISYAETVFATDDRVAELLLEYAATLARSSSADTVTVPGRVGDGGVEAVSILVGPASQMTTWSDAEPFGVDVADAVADLERRILLITRSIGDSASQDGPAIDDFDDLA